TSAARPRSRSAARPARNRMRSFMGASVPRTELGLDLVAVGTALACGLGPPPARIPASGTTALGSCLGCERQTAPRAMGAGRGWAEAIAWSAAGFAVALHGCAGCDGVTIAATVG